MPQGAVIFPIFVYYSCSSSSGKSLIWVCARVHTRAYACSRVTFTSLNYPQVSGLGWSRPHVGYGFWTADQTYCTERCNARNWWEADAYVFCNISQRDTGKYSAHSFSAGIPSHAACSAELHWENKRICNILLYINNIRNFCMEVPILWHCYQNVLPC